MIISVSRRTDIPAFYAREFMGQVEAGFCEIPNPFNPKQLSRVSLKAEDMEAFVFWSKDFRPLLPYLPELAKRGYDFVFLYTITGYGELLEPGVPPWQISVETIKQLAGIYGAQRIAWRYDPVIFSTTFDAQWHLHNFTCLAEALQGCSQRVILSLVDDYRRARGGIARLARQGEVLRSPTPEEQKEVFSGIAGFARQLGLEPQACAEEEVLSDWGIRPGACIDPGWLSRALGRNFSPGRDQGQRPLCNCAPAKDIGRYGTCRHGCIYCYAGHVYNK